MKFQVEVQEDKTAFFLELMKNLRFVKSVKLIEEDPITKTEDKK